MDYSRLTRPLGLTGQPRTFILAASLVSLLLHGLATLYMPNHNGNTDKSLEQWLWDVCDDEINRIGLNVGEPHQRV